MKRHRRDASTIRLSLPADKGGSIGSADDDERIEHGIIEQRSSSSHAKAVRHDALIGREDLDAIGGTFEVDICRLKRGCWTREVERLKPWRYIEPDCLHGRIIGK